MIRCPKCGKNVKVSAAYPGMLESVKEYECARCRGEYDKFEEKIEDTKIESDAA